MVSLLKFLTTIFFVALLFWLVLLNREPVIMTFIPLQEGIPLPLAVIIGVSMMLGFIWGGLIVWYNNLSVRADYRRQIKDLKNLEVEKSKESQKT